MTLKNRLVMPPMCMYSAEPGTGLVNDFHLAHYTARAIGGVGLVIVEATGVTSEGRITDQCLGLWDDAQIEGMKRLVDMVHSQGAKIALRSTTLAANPRPPCSPTWPPAPSLIMNTRSITMR